MTSWPVLVRSDTTNKFFFTLASVTLAKVSHGAHLLPVVSDGVALPVPHHLARAPAAFG